MRDLTAADVAFLLCSTKLGTFNLTLSTDFGLFLDISSDGAITARLDRPNNLPGRRRSTGPITPVSPIRDSIDAIMFTPTSTISPDFPISYPSSSFSLGHPTPTSPQFQRELLTPSGSSSPQGRKPLSIMTIHPPSIPTPEPTPPVVLSRPGYKYVITPAFGSPSGHRRASLLASSSSNYIFYSPSWPHNPRSSTISSLQVATPGSPKSPAGDSQEVPPPEILVREEDIEARYSLPSASGSRSSNWLDSYLDWVSRSQRASARQRRREERRARESQTAGHRRNSSSGSNSSSSSGSNSEEGQTRTKRSEMKGKGPFKDEGESTLWMVEGLLLAAWLCLQGDCAGVEYAPWGITGTRASSREGGNHVAEDEVYVLEKENLGKVIENVLVGLNGL